jgi:hypothetical protein
LGHERCDSGDDRCHRHFLEWYYITFSRVEQRPLVEVWPIQFQDALPTVPVPLIEPDPDATLDLAAAVAAVYERGGYATLIDYRRPPPPPKLAAFGHLPEVFINAGQHAHVLTGHCVTFYLLCL